MHDNILKYKNARYFFVTLAVLVICALIYASQGGEQPANGGTWQGYVLGTLGAVLIVWLTALESASAATAPPWVRCRVGPRPMSIWAVVY